MTDREKLIALIRNTYVSIPPLTYRAVVDDTAAAVLADRLLANGVVVREWIPVTERLPGTEKVLITDGEIVMRGYRRPDGVWKYGIELHEVWERLSLKRVTHWMPLPSTEGLNEE